MDDLIKQGLEQDRTIDITTGGCRSGQERRIEIWCFNIDGKIHIIGSPGTRGWYANVVANPELTFHPKHTVQADIPARCLPITDSEGRRKALLAIFDKLDWERDLDEWIVNSPLLEVDLDSSRGHIY